MDWESFILNILYRRILYPNLEDNAVVKVYPSVKGMQKDVYFLNHIHPEGGFEDSVSKYNMYEVIRYPAI